MKSNLHTCLIKMSSIVGKIPLLAAMGNPLYDLSLLVTDDYFIDKYALNRDGQKEIDSATLENITSDIRMRKLSVDSSPDGTSQNTLRVYQWITKEPYKTVYFGAVGNDENGILMKEKVEHDFVITRYANRDGFSTGTVVCFINGVTRTLTAHLGAASSYPVHLFYVPENVCVFSSLEVFYVEGFFVTHDIDTAVIAVSLCYQNGISIAFNLSGVYILKKYHNEVLYMISIADIVIGNSLEYLEAGKYISCKDCNNLKQVMYDLRTLKPQSPIQERSDSQLGVKFELKNKVVAKNRKIIIVTQNKDPTLCLFGEDEYLEIEVEPIEECLIKDTTAAGDAFTAGFLAGIISHQSLKESIRLGNRAARMIIQQIGCTLPQEKSSDYYLRAANAL